MRIHENDEDIRIPQWYMRLPVEVLDKVCGITMKAVKILPVRKRKKNTGNIRFNI